MNKVSASDCGARRSSQSSGAIKVFTPLMLLLACSSSALADESWVGIKCNAVTDRLIVYYFIPNRSDGGPTPRKGPNEWSVDDLIEVVDGIYEIHGVTRSCKLNHGDYSISIESSPDNMNPEGECGATISFHVDIRRGNESILTRHRLDSSRCNRPGGVTTTRIVIDASSSKPKLTEVPQDGD